MKHAAAEQDVREQPHVLRSVVSTNAASLAMTRGLLAGSTGVRMLALGSSRHAAGIGAAAIELLAGVPCGVLPAPGPGVPPPALRPGHLVVAVSRSGEHPALLDAVRAARAYGCPVVSVTNAPESTLARTSDVTLDCAAGPERVPVATKSMTAQVLLLAAIAAPPADVSRPVGQLLDADLDTFAPGAPPDRVVAGGLGAEWVAEEVAQKLSEMGGRLPAADALAEHLHAQAGRAAGRTLALVDPGDPTAALGGEVVRIGPDASYEVPTPPVGDPVAGAVVRLVAGQCAAIAWSRR